MKKAFLKVIHYLTFPWRTIIDTLRRKHLYEMDVDNDGIDEYVLDLNGRQEDNSHTDIDIINDNKEE